MRSLAPHPSLYRTNTRVWLTRLSESFVRIPFADLAGRAVQLADRMGSARYQRDGDEFVSRVSRP